MGTNLRSRLLEEDQAQRSTDRSRGDKRNWAELFMVKGRQHPGGSQDHWLAGFASCLGGSVWSGLAFRVHSNAFAPA